MPIKYNYGKNKELFSVELSAENWKAIERFIGKGVAHVKSASLTTSADYEDIKHIKPVSLEIERCKYGWIPMAFSTRTAWVKINVSYCFDPFQGIVNWLCKVSNGDLQTSIAIDEDGIEKTLCAESV